MQDESFFINNAAKGYKLWAPAGKPIHVPYTGSHKKVAMYGALVDDGTQVFQMHEKFNTSTFVSYLDGLRRKYGRILAIVDGASPHRSGAVADYPAKHHATVSLLRFPVGSPHLNAIEETWRRVRLEIQVEKYHGLFENLKRELSEYFRTTRFKIDLFKYLKRRLVVGNHFGA